VVTPDGRRAGVKKFYGEDGELSVEGILAYARLIADTWKADGTNPALVD